MRATIVIATVSTLATYCDPTPAPSVPDPCTEARYETAELVEFTFPATDHECVWYTPPADGAIHGVVTVVPGNGFLPTSYDHLMEHLARNGYVSGSCESPVGVDEATRDAIDRFGLPSDVDVALVGHSWGGKRAVEAANANLTANDPLDIAAVIGLAPVAPVDLHLQAGATPAYFVLYGGKDNDTTGWEGGGAPHVTHAPNASFAAYDRAGTEQEPGELLTTPPVLRSMAFVYGADHDGMTDNSIPCYAPADYLDKPLQNCITRAYVTGFVRWHLEGVDDFSAMFRDGWMPDSLVGEVSAESDGWGNPAGQPLQILTQYSPVNRRVIAHFEAAEDFQATAGLQVSVDDSHALDVHSPHDTRAMRIEWTNPSLPQSVTFPIADTPHFLTGTRRNVSTFDALTLRVGQLYDAGDIAHNPFNQDQSLRVRLTDEGGVSRMVDLATVGGIPYPERHELVQDGFCSRDGDYSKSAMRTAVIPLSRFTGVDLAEVASVSVELGTTNVGRVFIDNIEFISE